MLFTLLIYSKSRAQEYQIKFEEGTFDQALAKSVKEGKFLFIDCYTTWCIPCKMLEKEIFTKKNVAEYFNSKFISLRVDIEKGEGIELRKRFGVQPVPTLLFINSKGEVEHKFIGATTAEEFLKKSQEVFTNENRYGQLQRRYNTGERSPGFLALYLKELLAQSEYSKTKEILYELMTKYPEEKLCINDFWSILTHNFIAERNSEVYTLLIRNSDLLRKNIGQSEYDGKLTQLFIRYADIWIFSGVKEYNKKEFDALRKDVNHLKLKDHEEVLLIFDIAESRVRKDFNTYISLIEKSMDRIKKENVFGILINSRFLVSEGSVTQNRNFLNLIERFISKTNDDTYKKRLESIINELKTRLNSQAN